ncbi:MAG: ComF family protein [Thiohalomonadaceae bacterium]
MQNGPTVYHRSFLVHVGACALCGVPGTLLCAGCHADLPRLDAACERCGEPLPVAGVCGHCLREPPPFDRTRAAFRYASPLSELVLRLKFQGALHLALLLGELLAGRLVAADPRPDLIVPVPLHPARLASRGYNQALELGRPLARALGVPLAHDLCRRVRDTAAQSSLDPEGRRRNVRGAFAVYGPVPARVAILDDVITTGATLAELARVLRRAGARHVEAWALARTGR